MTRYTTMNEQGFLDVMSRRQALQRMGVLAGGTLSASLVSGVLAGCRAEPSEAEYVPRTLQENQYELVQALTEIIIPATDTPGARDVGVPAFIDKMLTDWYLDEDKRAFLTGLDGLDEQSVTLYGSPFVDADAEEQTALLETMAQAAFPDNAEGGAGESVPPELAVLFKMVKELTVVGYYTSEAGATVELRDMPMGAYRGDIPYDEVGRAWS